MPPLLAPTATHDEAAAEAGKLAEKAQLGPEEIALVIKMVTMFGPSAYAILRKLFKFLPPLPTP